MKHHPIAVVAGTPVDTHMGVGILKAQGLSCSPFPISVDPQEQTLFQVSPAEEKHRHLLSLLQEAQALGCAKVFVYCNSLASAVDFPALATETGLHIVTPLDVYAQLAPRFQNLAFIAANAQGLAGVERALLSANPRLSTLSASLLPAVFAIENGMAPEMLVERFRLGELVQWFQACGMEALLLGCTHFPYFKEALARQTDLPIIDPAEEMAALLRN